MENLIENGKFFMSDKTDTKIANIINQYYQSGKRLRFFYGDPITGRDFLEDYDIIGYIGRSTGTKKIPLLINNKNSSGGIMLSTDMIVKITLNKKVIYQHEKYHILEENLTSDWEKHNIDFFKGLTNKKKRFI